MLLEEGNNERAESYRILADIYSEAPAEDGLEAIRRDLELESKDAADAVIADFNSLFRYPDGRLLPVESLFLSTMNVVAVSDVKDFYSEAGLEMDARFELIPDHLSLEFLFMSYLIDIRRLDLQGRFLEEHLMNWVPFYCEEVTRQAQTGFYREIAEITTNFLDNEYGNFG